MIECLERAVDIDRRRVVGIAIVLITAAFALGSVVPGTVAGGETPGEPASFFGSATDEDGTEIPEGVSIVGVVDGNAVNEIEIDTDGEYGGEGAFDDKLRIDSTAGDEVTFHLTDADGPAADTVDLEAGVFEKDLVFPDGAIEYVHPEAAIDITPTSAEPNETIDFSATESSAHEDAELVTFGWTISYDSNEIATFDGESVHWHSDVEGTYEIELEVIDTAGFTDTTTATFDISSEEIEETDDETESSDNGGGDGGGGTATGGGGSAGGGGSVAGGGGGTTTDGSGSDSSLNESSDTNGTGSDGTGGDSSSTGESDRTVEPIAHETVRIDDVFPDAAGTTVILDEPSMREIVFTNDSASGDVSIREFDEIAGGAPPLSEELRIVSASVIDVPTDQVDDAAIIRAIVDPAWLEARGLVPDQLIVYRFPTDGERWHELPTEAFEVDRGVVVEAETPGFSQFVIAGPEAPERPGSEAAAEDGTDESDSTTASPDVEASNTITETTADESDDSGGSGLVGLVFVLVSVLVVVWIGGRFLIPRRPDEWIP